MYNIKSVITLWGDQSGAAELKPIGDRNTVGVTKLYLMDIALFDRVKIYVDYGSRGRDSSRLFSG